MFCYCCGIIGHSELECEYAGNGIEARGVKQYGSWLRSFPSGKAADKTLSSNMFLGRSSAMGRSIFNVSGDGAGSSSPSSRRCLLMDEVRDTESSGKGKSVVNGISDSHDFPPIPTQSVTEKRSEVDMQTRKVGVSSIDVEILKRCPANFEVQVSEGDAVMTDFTESREKFGEQLNVDNLVDGGSVDFMERNLGHNSLNANSICLENHQSDMAINSISDLPMAQDLNGVVLNPIDRRYLFFFQ